MAITIHQRLFTKLRPLAALLVAFTPASAEEAVPGLAPSLANPILPGYYADPSLVSDSGKHYLYATIDPWGGETLACWESGDFKTWTYRVLNWPTKKACTSPTSKDAMVWAPSVVRGRDGRFYMYVSVGNEVWAGVAGHPLGPWRDANGGKPLIPENFRPGFHMIDAEAFIDTDGQAYLYWGSGWNWVNGKCWAVRLKPDMITFDGEVADVTPARYFEAPFMVKHGNRYHLMYSGGKTIEDTYQVHYATGDSPLGPFKEAASSPVLVTDRSANVSSPGHHAVFERDGRHYILYHRHSIPFNPEFIGRQICVDEMRFDDEGFIEKVVPTHDGPPFIRRQGASVVVMKASSQRDPHSGAQRAADDNHATLWAAARGSGDSWLEMDLREARRISSQEIRFEYAWKTYRFVVQSSMDGKEWTPLADHGEKGISGSPVVIAKPTEARFLRLVFPAAGNEGEPGIFEWIAK